MEYLQQLSEIGWEKVITVIILLILAIPTIGEAIGHFIEFFGVETKWSRQQKAETQKLNDLEAEMRKYKENRIHDREQSFAIQKELVDSLESLRVANKSVLADRINQKYKYYLKIKGIPEDEFDEFVQMHDAYKGVGGNHSIDQKFEKAMELPVLTIQEMMERGIL